VQEAIDGARRKGYAPKPTIINAVPAVIGEQQEKPFSILDFCAENFTGEPEPIEWLFDEVVPLGIPMMVAAMGDTGKSYMALHACCRVAYGPQKMMEREEVFGGVTAKSGRAVFITAEDSRATLHRRINELDQRGAAI
jgi:RecA-family ATPase